MLAYILLGLVALLVVALLWARSAIPESEFSRTKQPPPFTSLALRLLLQLPWKRNASPSLKIPKLTVSASSLPLPASNHVAYARYCTYLSKEEQGDRAKEEQAREASLGCFLEVLCLPYQMSIIIHPSFPLQGLGIIHLKNVITVERRVDLQQELSFVASVEGQRWTEAGSEVDVVLLAYQGKVRVWRCVATLLSRGSQKGGKKAQRQVEEQKEDVETQKFETTWKLSQSTGVGYAKVSGDWNPHHLHPITAFPFGFPGPIAHGMYTLARSMSDVMKSGLWKLEYPYKVSCEFKRPLVLPSTVAVKGEKLPSSPLSPAQALSFSGLVPPAEEVKNGKAVSFGVYSTKGVPHMKASFVVLDSLSD